MRLYLQSTFTLQRIADISAYHRVTMRIFLLTVLVAGAMAQDTYNCPDGWNKQEDRDACRCFLLSGSEAVTKADATILCNAHAGAWVAEIDRPGRVNL